MLRRATLTALLAAAAGTAQAESIWVGGAGAADTTRVGYLGVAAPLGSGTLGDGWSVSLFTDHARYEYDLASRRIAARASAARVGVLRQFRTHAGTLGVGLGAQLRETRLSPDDMGNRNRGAHLRPVAELQWRTADVAVWRTAFFGQYTFGSRSDYAKTFVGRAFGGDVALGMQAWTGGDGSYRVYGAGITADGWRRGPARLTLTAGAEHAEGERTRPAVGIEFSFYRD